jgi:hypothetical protein
MERPKLIVLAWIPCMTFCQDDLLFFFWRSSSVLWMSIGKRRGGELHKRVFYISFGKFHKDLMFSFLQRMDEFFPVKISLISLTLRVCRTSLSLAKWGLVGKSKNRRRTAEGFYIFLSCLQILIKFNKTAVLWKGLLYTLDISQRVANTL